MRKRHYYSPEEIDFLRANAKYITNQELTDRFNSKFGTNISTQCISRIKSNYHIKSGYNAGQFTSERLKGNKFRLGLKPVNGFKRGNIPHTNAPLGSERVNKDGCIIVKIDNPRKWKLKHHIIYEQYHHVKIKPREKIIFLDNNKRNFDINNLVKLTNKQQIILSRISIKSNIPEITLAEIELVKYREKIQSLIKKTAKKRSI